MNDKIERPKAYCENCDRCEKNGYRCARTGALVNKAEYCSYYYGEGQTPEQRIAELEAAPRAITADDVRKAVKELVWKGNEENYKWVDVSGLTFEIANSRGRFVGCVNGRAIPSIIEQTDMLEGQKAFQDWLIDLILSALGLGKDGK